MKIRKVFVVFICSFFQLITSLAQDTRLWGTYYGGLGGDYVNQYYDNCVTTDNSGNVFVAGYTTSTNGIASGGFQNTFGGGSVDAYLVKFDASGNRIWATYYGGSSDDYGYNVITDLSGNVYLAGYTNSTSGIAFGGFMNTFGGGSYNAFLVKFDASGNRLWATYYGGAIEEKGWGLATDVLGNVYLAGYTVSPTGIASGGFQNTISGGGDAFLVKFDSAGNRIWATYYGGTLSEYGTSVATDGYGNVYLGGYTTSLSGIASGGFQNSIGGDSDAFLVKFDAAGNRIWSTYYGGVGSDDGYSVAIDDSGNVYLSGVANSASNIASPGGFQNTFGGGGYDAFLVKFGPLGNRIWATYYGNIGDESGSVATDSSGNVYLSGGTSSTSGIASFDGFQNVFGGGASDSYLVKFNKSGNRICATYYGGTFNEYGSNLATNISGNLYLAGYTNSTSGIAAGGFQNVFGGGGADAFLVKFTSFDFCIPIIYSQTITICSGQNIVVGANVYNANGLYKDTLLAVSGCDSIVNTDLTVSPNITGNQTVTLCSGQSITVGQNTYNTTGVYTDILIAADGCDSTLTTNLTVTSPINVGTTLAGTSITANQVGATYQWVNCIGNIPIVGATNQTYTALTNGSYAVIVTIGNCSDTSLCTNINTDGIKLNIKESNILIYPNPNNGLFTVELNGKSQISIINTLGEVVLVEELDKGKQNINLLKCADGIYFVKIIREGKQQIVKLIKEK